MTTARSVERIEQAVRDRLPAGVRVLVGMLWLTNVDWKFPPDFGQQAGRGLYRFVSLGVEHSPLPPYSWVLENLVLPNIEVFGWFVIAVEATLAALLLSGTYTRTAAVIGLGQSLAIGLTVMNAPREWYWAYLMMMTLHAAVFATGAGRVWAVDGIRKKLKTAPGAAETMASVRNGKLVTTALLAGTGLLILALQMDHPFATADYPRAGIHWLRGSMAMGVVFVVLALACWLSAGKSAARAVGGSFLVIALAAVVTYRSDVNVLSAAPSTAAIIAGAACYLIASSRSAPPPRVQASPVSQAA